MVTRSNLITIFVSIGAMVPIIAVSKLFMIKLVLNTGVTSESVILAVIGSLPVYLLDRAKKPEEDRVNENKSERRKIVDKYKKKIKILSFLLIITYIITNFVLLDPLIALVAQAHFILFIIYPKTKKFILVDTMVVGAAWSTFLVSLVIFYAEESFSLWLTFSMFISMFMMKIGETELSNIRDKEADIEVGHPTLPAVYNEEKTIVFTSFCLIISLMILSYYTTYPQFLLFVIGSAPILYSYVSHNKRSVEKTIYLDRVCKIAIGLTALVTALLF